MAGSWTSMARSAALVAGVTAAGVLIAACGSTAPRSRMPFLAERYMPSASAPADARVPAGAEAVPSDPEQRRQLVMAPDGNVYTLRWRKYSSSIGKANGGRLVDPAKLPSKGPGYRHIGKHPYGTDETIAYVQWAAWAVQQQFPGTVPVVVGDISDDDGGRLRPHRSHQSGRDVDIGFYARNNRRLKWFKALGDDLDVRKTWVFIEALIRTGQVQYIFIDRHIQTMLHEHAASLGFDDDDLKSVFQYPGGNRGALIRHVRGHRNHLHVRFKCVREDQDCE